MKKSCHKFIIRSIIKIFNQFLLYFNHFHNLTVTLEIYIILINIYIYYFFLFKIFMKRQPATQTSLKKEELAKLYREFSRQKYNKYKHQFPRMRESQLVSKIIKEWEAMDSQEKVKLYNEYTNEKHISDDKSQSSEKKQSPGSSKQKKKKSQSKSVGKRGVQQVSSSTPSKKSNIRVFVQSSSSKKQKAQSQSSDFARDGVKKDFQISQSPQSKQLGTRVGGKKKRITKEQKQPRTQYLKFFKFYYEKLTKQHSRWSANQISTIIKLLWKKKLSQDKTATKTSLRTPRQRKSISGRMAFRRTFGYNGIEGAQRWKQLPVQSKKYWRSKGQGSRSGQRKVIRPLINGVKVRKGSESSINSHHGSGLKFLKSTMA